MKTMKRLALSLLAIAGGLILSGCVEESTVIKVNRDGSGVIHERIFSGASDDVIGFPGLSSKDKDEKKPDEEKVKLPSEADLKAYAATLGEGVTFKSVKAATNKKGWKGYEILYEFKDINTVRYIKNTPKPKSGDEGDEGEDDGENKDEKDDDFGAVFAMKDGKLSITVEHPESQKPTGGPAQHPDSPTIDPYADAAGPSPSGKSLASQAMSDSMMKAMTKGMRMGIFVQIEGEIADTNAKHRNGNLITLLDADIGKLFNSEEGMAALDQLENAPRAEFQAAADQIDGLDVDLQDPIVVEIK